jgi:hypothetical protein
LIRTTKHYDVQISRQGQKSLVGQKLAGFCSKSNENDPGSGRPGISDGEKPLKMRGTGKSHLPVS